MNQKVLYRNEWENGFLKNGRALYIKQLLLFCAENF